MSARSSTALRCRVFRAMNNRLEFAAPPLPAERFDYFDELLEDQKVRLLVEAEFGTQVPGLRQLRQEQRLFCVVRAGEELYPAFQWQEGRLVPALQGVLNVLAPHRGAWTILAWLTADNRHLQGARPADLLFVAPADVSQAARLDLHQKLDSLSRAGAGRRL